MLPFFSALLWGIVLSVSSWPLYRRLVSLLGGRRSLAASLMAVAMLCIILLPFVIVGANLGDNIKELTAATRRWMDAGPPPPPKWLAKVPAVGRQAAETWQSLATDSSKLLAASKRFIEPVSGWMLTVAMALGRGLLELALSILVAFFLFRDSGKLAERLGAAVERIAGERGPRLLEVAGRTVSGVVYGILGTALVQAVMAGIGFFVAGVPGAGLLALLTFFLSPVPAGPVLVVLPAALWLFHQGSSGWGTFMLIWGAGVSTRGQLRQAVADQPGQRHAVSVDLLWRGRRRSGVRFHRRLHRANSPGGWLSARAGMGLRQPHRRDGRRPGTE